MGNAIEILNLTKEFRNNKVFNDISISFTEKKIYGVFGRYGAGKTTLLNLISTKFHPTLGEIKVFGENPYKSSKVLDNICFSRKDVLFSNNITFKRIINENSKFYPNWNNELANYLTEYLKLKNKNRYKDFSPCDQSAINLIISLCSNSSITLYDEPFANLTDSTSSFFSDLVVKDYNENPKTIILAEQAINEYNNIFQHAVMLDNCNVTLVK